MTIETLFRADEGNSYWNPEKTRACMGFPKLLSTRFLGFLRGNSNGNGVHVAENGGVPIVLTASEVEMSDFNLNLVASFAGSFPLRFMPRLLTKKMFYPANPFNEGGTARFAPYGLRKIEALLIKEFGKDNVVTQLTLAISRGL